MLAQKQIKILLILNYFVFVYMKKITKDIFPHSYCAWLKETAE